MKASGEFRGQSRLFQSLQCRLQDSSWAEKAPLVSTSFTPHLGVPRPSWNASAIFARMILREALHWTVCCAVDICGRRKYLLHHIFCAAVIAQGHSANLLQASRALPSQRSRCIEQHLQSLLLQGSVQLLRLTLQRKRAEALICHRLTALNIAGSKAQDVPSGSP